MATVNQSSNVSSDRRPIALRLRPDLVIEVSNYQGEDSWVVKDPVALKYFQLREPEYFASQMLDGDTSAVEIRDALEAEFPELKITTETIHFLVNSLHKNGLLISDLPGQSEPLKQRRNKELKQKATQLLMSVMSIRFPGVDPEPFLNWLYPKVRFLFWPSTTLACVLLMVSATVLVLSNLNEFYSKLPEFGQFFNVRNMLFMGAIMIVTKSIHELGHGLMCKHFGGECHEIGFMLLVMTPAMYCNTSDSWLLPNKWHRIAIGAAGMYVEMVIAAVATFVWWHTHPGWLHYLALNTIFLCSVSTIVFNLNPLLRYDGYYMLSDYLEIPNLAQKSKTSMVNWLRVACLGMKPVQHRSLPKRRKWAFAAYSVASFFYRWFVMLMIFWFLIQIFEPYGLSVVAHAMIVMSLVGMIVIPMFKLTKFFLYPGRLREVKKLRLFISATLVAGLAAFLFSVPVSRNVTASFVLRPVDADQVFVVEPGKISELMKSPGETVSKGETIAILESDKLELEAEQLKGDLARETAVLATLKLANRERAGIGRQIAETSARIAKIRGRMEVQSRKESQLKLVAARDGQIIEAPNVAAPPANEFGAPLQRWSGTPLDPQNRNAFLEASTLFCIVGDPNQMQAMLVVDESDIKLVDVGQKVQLMLDEFPGERFEGEVINVSRDSLSELPRELSITNGGKVAVEPNQNGGESPLLTSYEVFVSLHGDHRHLLTGFRGNAKIEVSSLPLGQQLVRYVQTVINFR
ncbi:HlyD family efflux transporter periplasmic adaptor subunit [Mariniblastus fucicola]|uniref:Peptidase family M50 n=1 Tax=Mariniblastus fucicola TaxID=980251 RepID=A0A5B9P7J5_9BACT|nr:HlyD family efflux transporter periplasmic adaptor subunit [Mariniblastus fucicola]QEG21175.1 Peptidase family M50 [Mariniblastus fucicola]